MYWTPVTIYLNEVSKAFYTLLSVPPCYGIRNHPDTNLLTQRKKKVILISHSLHILGARGQTCTFVYKLITAN